MKNQSDNTMTVDQYIASAPEHTQEILRTIRKQVQKQVPDAVESISYEMPAFKLNGKPLIYFAGWQEHIGIYPTPSGVSALDAELAPYKHAKGSVNFPLDKPIPYDLIEKMVLVRKEEIETGAGH
jgi:uncharacterized protein YdhG (YjbR/CyaY superfamily)